MFKNHQYIFVVLSDLTTIPADLSDDTMERTSSLSSPGLRPPSTLQFPEFNDHGQRAWSLPGHSRQTTLFTFRRQHKVTDHHHRRSRSRAKTSVSRRSIARLFLANLRTTDHVFIVINKRGKEDH